MSEAARLWRLLGWLVLLLIVLAFPIRYAQQIALGRVVLYTGILRLTLFVLVFALASWTAGRNRSREQLRVIAIGYILVSVFLYNAIIVDFGAFYTAYGFDIFCVPPAIALLFLMNSAYLPLRGEKEEHRIVLLLLLIAVPIALFGIIQFALGDQILHTGFAATPQDELGSVGQASIRLTELASTRQFRANSIFGSAIDFGHFDVLFALLCIAMAVKSRRRSITLFSYLVLSGVFVVAAASTSTRNILVYLACCVIGCLSLLAGLGIRALVALALSFVAAFYGTIYGAIELAPRLFLGFFDVVSLFQRTRGVYATVDRYIVNADSPIHILFGFGYMQSLDFKFLPTTVFDNTELDIYLYAGVCGVVVYAVLLFVMFRHAVRMWRHTNSVVWLAASSLLVGTPLFSTLNIDLDQPFLLFVFALTVSGWLPSKARAAVLDEGLVGHRTSGWEWPESSQQKIQGLP
jgi:hypothetical protein